MNFLKTIALAVLLALGCDLRAAPDAEAPENKDAQRAASEFYEKHQAWPKSLLELADFADGRRLPFKREGYSALTFTVQEDGKLKIEQTFRSGKTATLLCTKPPSDATVVIKNEGYLIVQDGSSYYFLHRDGTFLSAPLDRASGRLIKGTYVAEATLFFRATGTIVYIDRPSHEDRCRLTFGIDSVETDGQPFDARNFAPFAAHKDYAERLPKTPLYHKAYFAFDSLEHVKD